MPLTAAIDHQHRRVLTLAREEITLLDIERHLGVEEEQGSLWYQEMVDGREGTVRLTPAEIRQVVTRLRELRSRYRLGPTAVVVEDDFDYGMVRMLSVLAEDICRIEVFRSMEEAEQWLGGQPEAS